MWNYFVYIRSINKNLFGQLQSCENPFPKIEFFGGDAYDLLPIGYSGWKVIPRYIFKYIYKRCFGYESDVKIYWIQFYFQNTINNILFRFLLTYAFIIVTEPLNINQATYTHTYNVLTIQVLSGIQPHYSQCNLLYTLKCRLTTLISMYLSTRDKQIQEDKNY